MLKIIEEPKDKNIIHQFQHSFGLHDYTLFKWGVWMEYWENEVINYKFHWYLGSIYVISGSFLDSYTPEEIEIFVKNTLKIEELKEWLDSLDFKILDIKKWNSPDIQEIWKYDYRIYPSKVQNSEAYTKYHEVQLEGHNIKILPNSDFGWATVKLKSDEPGLNKWYWFDLCLLKFFIYEKSIELN